MNRKALPFCSIAPLIVLVNGLVACSGKPVAEPVAGPEPAVDTPQASDTLMDNGKRVFSSCASCHTVNKDGGNTIGPNLWGVFDSGAASKADFAYSDALRNSGVVWTEKSLDKYLTNPGEYLPGGTMAFPGVAAEEDRKALLAFLAKVSTDSDTELAVPSQQGGSSAIWE